MKFVAIEQLTEDQALRILWTIDAYLRQFIGKSVHIETDVTCEVSKNEQTLMVLVTTKKEEDQGAANE